MSNRSEITKGLAELLERRLSESGTFWAKEVSIEPLGRIRPDYVSVGAYFGKFASMADIEHAHVSVFEIKSCLADYKSGSGLNHIGDTNVIVAPFELKMKINELNLESEADPEGLWGWMYPFPESDGRIPDIANLPEYEGQVDGWKLYHIESNGNTRRQAPLLMILWAMIYAGVRW